MLNNPKSYYVYKYESAATKQKENQELFIQFKTNVRAVFSSPRLQYNDGYNFLKSQININILCPTKEQ